MFSTHSTAEWFKEKGRHPIFAAGKEVPLESAVVPAAAPIPAAAIGRPSSQEVPAMAAMSTASAGSCGTSCGCN